MSTLFKELQISDIPVIRSLLQRNSQRIACYTTENMFAWRKEHEIEWMMFGDRCLLFSFFPFDHQDQKHFFQPIGAVTEKDYGLIERIIKDRDYPPKFFNVDEQFIKEHPNFVNRFDVMLDKDLLNYEYETRKIVELKGREFGRKRTMISMACRLYNWSSEPLTTQNYRECFSVLEGWLAHASSEDIGYRVEEISATKEALNLFPEMAYRGVLIRVDQNPVGFSLYSGLNLQTADISFMKADRKYKGIAEILHNQTASAILKEGYDVVNMEEDWGIPGIRKFKKSYAPCNMRPSYTLELKN